MAHKDDAPKRDGHCEVLSEGEADGEVGAGPGPEEVSEVEDGGCPAVFCSNEFLGSIISHCVKIREWC
jgi:hypothetical protein